MKFMTDLINLCDRVDFNSDFSFMYMANFQGWSNADIHQDLFHVAWEVLPKDVFIHNIRKDWRMIMTLETEDCGVELFRVLNRALVQGREACFVTMDKKLLRLYQKLYDIQYDNRMSGLNYIDISNVDDLLERLNSDSPDAKISMIKDLQSVNLINFDTDKRLHVNNLFKNLANIKDIKVETVEV